MRERGGTSRAGRMTTMRNRKAETRKRQTGASLSGSSTRKFSISTRRTCHASDFPFDRHRILDEGNLNAIISWGIDGTSFVVHVRSPRPLITHPR